MDDPAKEVSIDEFKKLEIRVGVLSRSRAFPELKSSTRLLLISALKESDKL